jgi:hypothetical protein
MALLDSMGAYGTGKALAYGRVRATGKKWIDQINVLPAPQSGHFYNVGDIISDGTYQQVCVTAGLSGSGLPGWNESPGGLTGWGGAAFKNGGSTNGAGTQYGLWVLGEGEWDGFDILWNQTSPLFAVGLGYDIGTGLYDAGPTLLNPAAIHFHSGTDGAFGASLPVPSSNGPDQGADNWLAELPTGAAIITQCYSRMAYYMMKWLPQFIITDSFQINQIGQTLNPIGDWRALRCRIFDDLGNQVGYEWTQNPAWHYVDACLRCMIMPRSEYQLNMVINSGPSYVTYPEALDSAALDKFDWGSIYEFAQDCDYVLPNGKPRFQGNYAFSSQTTLAAITEQILLCSRGYQQEYAGKLFLNMDKPRPSYFTLTDQHQIPYTLELDDKEVHQNANDMTGEFSDTNLAAVCTVASILYTTGDPEGPALIITSPNENPCAPWDVIQIGGNSNPALNRQYQVNNIISDYAFKASVYQGTAPSDGATGTGGVMGYPQARFQQRDPELWHQSHAVARGQIGP